MDLLSVVIPVYNEEQVAGECYTRLSDTLKESGMQYELIFVNDGSRDKTADIIKELGVSDKRVKLVSFARNFGHQIAVTAGMDYALGDAIVIIDADLQDPPELILKMLEKWREGYEVVYGQRVSREGETWFKKATAKLFYRALRLMTDVEIPIDTGDFRLIDRKVCEAMKELPEHNRFIRGLVSWVGFRQTAILYERQERFAGVTKYPLKKMLKFAGDGIISFSHKPLKLATYFGFLLSAASFLYLIFVMARRIFASGEGFASGWASIIAVNLFFNGVVLIILGIIGEYIGRIYDESKSRPLYIVGERMNIDEED